MDATLRGVIFGRVGLKWLKLVSRALKKHKIVTFNVPSGVDVDK
jgi:hypothetical protein